MADETRAPGLKWRPRANGQRAPYWIARADLVRRGYTPKVVPLSYDPTDPDRDAILAHRCRVLHAEMLEWASGRAPHQAFDGTLKSLVTAYESDPDSPFKDLKPITQRTYSYRLRALVQTVGSRRLDAVSGADVRRWYKNIAAPKFKDDVDHTPNAYLSIAILKAVVSYGASRGSELASPNPCISLREQMSAAKFTQPAARKTRITYLQLVAFRAAAVEEGSPSMALGLTLQYELAFRQRDVIGEWIDKRWANGLTWDLIGKDGVLRKRTSKTGAEASHRIADYPELVAELERVPSDRRVGPIVVFEKTGLPYTYFQYYSAFRRIAKAAKIPAGVWNMDARAGAVTEAYEAGASTEGAMALATHTQASTSRRYLRETTEAGSKVAQLRVGSRKKE